MLPTLAWIVQGLQSEAQGDILLEICSLKGLSAHWASKKLEYLNTILEFEFTGAALGWLDVIDVGFQAILAKEVPAALKSGRLPMALVTFGHLSWFHDLLTYGTLVGLEVCSIGEKFHFFCLFRLNVPLSHDFFQFF